MSDIEIPPSGAPPSKPAVETTVNVSGAQDSIPSGVASEPVSEPEDHRKNRKYTKKHFGFNWLTGDIANFVQGSFYQIENGLLAIEGNIGDKYYDNQTEAIQILNLNTQESNSFMDKIRSLK